jgi:hypothetical protein
LAGNRPGIRAVPQQNLINTVPAERRDPISAPDLPESFFRTLDQDIIFFQIFKGLIKNQLSLMQESHKIGGFLQVACDVRRKEDGRPALRDKFPEDSQNIAADNRIQPRRDFIQNQKNRMMRQGCGKRQFHFHPFGHLPNRPGRADLEPGKKLKKLPAASLRVNSAHNRVQIFGRQARMETAFIHGKTDIPFAPQLLFLAVPAENADAAAVPFDLVQDQADQRCFAGPVLTNQADNLAIRDFQGNGAKPEVRICFCHTVDFEDRIHFFLLAFSAWNLLEYGFEPELMIRLSKNIAIRIKGGMGHLTGKTGHLLKILSFFAYYQIFNKKGTCTKADSLLSGY